MSILIKQALLDSKTVDVLIEAERIKAIAEKIEQPSNIEINASGKAIIPGFVNGHGHSAMTLFRGFGDDMELQPWLKQKIWPYEAILREEDVYWGAKLACLEMIKNGTTCINDMYHFCMGTARAFDEMGLRIVLSDGVFDHFNAERTEKAKKYQETCHATITQKYSNRIRFALGPHAIYTVSAGLFKWVKEYADANDLLIHTHIAETQTEYRNAIKDLGQTPVQYMHSLGVLSPRTVLAHMLWVSEEDIKLIADSGAKVVHNPASNLKLASGSQFKYKEMSDAGVIVGIGTDGCASSNNLNMIEAGKWASLLQKGWRFDPTVMKAEEVFDAITKAGGEILQQKIGKIEEGYYADLCLVDLNRPELCPNFNFISNLIYSASPDCINTVICNGKILMQNRIVEGEDEIREQACKTAYNLCGIK